MITHQPAWGSKPGSRAALFGLSLLLHAALLWLFLMAQPGQDRGQVWPRVSTDLVWIRTPPPKPAPPPPVAVVRPREPEAARPASPARRPRAERVAKGEQAEQAEQAAPEAKPPATPVTEPVAASTPPAPAFDREAALSSARRIATEGEPFRAGMALAQAPARPVYGETKDEKLGRAIAGAKRGNCLGPNAGGSLLTPLMWLIDKKDGGCKF